MQAAPSYRLPHDVVDPHGLRPGAGRRAAQLLDQPRHAIDGVGDRGDGVVDELRIVLVPLRVGDHESELGDRILEVVHHECRQPVVRFELPALGETAICVVLRELRGDVPPDRLEQVAILKGEIERRRRFMEHEETRQPVEFEQRRDDGQRGVRRQTTAAD